MTEILKPKLKRKKASGRVVSDPQMNSYAHSVGKIQMLRDEIAALENRCKVAEDLNKIYVRMYLEMQDKYDRVCKLVSEDFDPFVTKPGSYFKL